MLEAYLSTLAPALLNVKTFAFISGGFSKTDELLNRPCSHRTVCGQEDSWVVCSYWRRYSEVEMRTAKMTGSTGEEGDHRNGG